MSLVVGVVAEPVAGHLNPALTVGRSLRRRGHQVVVYGIPDVAAVVGAAGLEHRPFGVADFPPGALRSRWLAPGRTRGRRALVEQVRLHTQETHALCRDVPAAARADGVDVLLVDQLQVAGPHLADAAGVPFATLCAGPGLLRLPDHTFPPPFLDKEPSRRRRDRLVNRIGYLGMEVVAAPRIRATNRFAHRRGLPVRRRLQDLSSPHVQLCPLVRELNFGIDPPAGSALRYVGPLIDDQRPPVPFPWERLDGRPLVYASLGTVQDRAGPLYRVIAEACARLDVQLVVTGGDADGAREPVALPDNVVVVREAPQLDLLRRAALCITHCGMNTTAECAALGVPVVGVPLAYDQPAVAARIRHAGFGRIVGPRHLDASSLRQAVREVLDVPAYRARALELSAACRAAGGPAAAADAIEATAGLSGATST